MFYLDNLPNLIEQLTFGFGTTFESLGTYFCLSPGRASDTLIP